MWKVVTSEVQWLEECGVLWNGQVEGWREDVVKDKGDKERERGGERGAGWESGRRGRAVYGMYKEAAEGARGGEV